MNTIVLLLLLGNLLTVTAPQSVAAPMVDGVLAQMVHDETTFVYAHSNLAGTLFYDLRDGDVVIAIYSDGSLREFEVVQIGAYAAQSTEIAKGGGNFDLRVNYQWIPITGVMTMYSIPGRITLSTCFADNKGFGIVTGRLFISLAPVDAGDFPE